MNFFEKWRCGFLSPWGALEKAAGPRCGRCRLNARPVLVACTITSNLEWRFALLMREWDAAMLFDLNRTMFFKAKFDVECDEGDDALWSVIMSLRFWLRGKAEQLGYSMPWGNDAWSSVVRAGGVLRAEGADVELRSCIHYDGDACAWACELSEVQKAVGRAPRKWITEIGYQGQSRERGCVSIVLSYGDHPGFIGDLQDRPSLTIPRLITALSENEHLSCSTSGVPVGRMVWRFDDPQPVFDLIASASRETPIVFLSPVSGATTLIDAAELSNALGPNAIVVCASDRAAADRLNTLLSPYGLECYGGAIRVYDQKPAIERPDERARHRYLSARRIADAGSSRVVAMLRRALAQDVHFWQQMLRIEDVKRMNRQSANEKRLAGLKDKFESEALDEILRMEREKDDAELLCDQALAENDLLKKENFDLSNRNDCLEQAFRAAAPVGRGFAVDCLRKLPSDALSAAKLAVAVFLDAIDFTNRGWKSLESCTASVDVVWAALFDLCTVLRPIFCVASSADPASEFQEKSVFKYSRSEGMQTRKDSRLMGLRDDVYQGRPINIETHIGSNTGDAKSSRFIRVYFAWDDESGKIVVGHCGTHLENYSSKSIR